MNLINKRVLVTGAAGFIGYHLCALLIKQGAIVFGIDNISDYYDINLKYDRLAMLRNSNNFHFWKVDLHDADLLEETVLTISPDIVIHLAAQAGVRYSIDNPRSYFNSNLSGTFNLIESLKNIELEHFLMASTSSVYGANKSLPFDERQKCDTQMSFYAATKKACENITHSYSHIHGIPITIFRFFTVYGPWGRPDMALYKFTEAILNDRPIQIFNNGNMTRDFTYVEDLVKSIVELSQLPPVMNQPVNPIDTISDIAPWRVVNIGNGNERPLMDYIGELELQLQKVAKKDFLPMQQGDVKSTLANCDVLFALTGYKPDTPMKEGIQKFVQWYLDYKGLK